MVIFHVNIVYVAKSWQVATRPGFEHKRPQNNNIQLGDIGETAKILTRYYQPQFETFGQKLGSILDLDRFGLLSES